MQNNQLTPFYKLIRSHIIFALVTLHTCWSKIIKSICTAPGLWNNMIDSNTFWSSAYNPIRKLFSAYIATKRLGEITTKFDPYIIVATTIAAGEYAFSTIWNFTNSITTLIRMIRPNRIYRAISSPLFVVGSTIATGTVFIVTAFYTTFAPLFSKIKINLRLTRSTPTSIVHRTHLTCSNICSLTSRYFTFYHNYLHNHYTVGWRVCQVRVRFGGGRYDNSSCYDDQGSAARFFYCAKASKKEKGDYNTHPTVKPLALNEYLARLILPPTLDIRILIPFSGSEIIGAAQAGWDTIVAVEREKKYNIIAKRRLKEMSGAR